VLTIDDNHLVPYCTYILRTTLQNIKMHLGTGNRYYGEIPFQKIVGKFSVISYNASLIKVIVVVLNILVTNWFVFVEFLL
jgi:hypothetical protein